MVVVDIVVVVVVVVDDCVVGILECVGKSPSAVVAIVDVAFIVVVVS